VVVELALLLPFLALLLFGTVEIGTSTVAASRLDSAVSQAARVGAAGGTLSTVDRDVLLALRAALPAEQVTRLDRVVVYRASAPDAGPPAGCLKAVGSTSEIGAVGCNSYTGATVRALTPQTTAGFGGAPGARDAFWPPASRKDHLADPPDYLGVWVRTAHQGVTGVSFLHLDLSSKAVYRIQPDLVG
jgi:hypothetical protein